MILLNEANLEETELFWIKELLGGYDHNPLAISATTIIDSPRIIVLKILFHEDMIMEAGDTGHLLLGDVVHISREKSLQKMIRMGLIDEGDIFFEDNPGRLVREIELSDGKKVMISGKPDEIHLVNKAWHLVDTKVIKVWNVANVKNKKMKDKHQQLWVYAWLISRGFIQDSNGLPGQPFSELMRGYPLHNEARLRILLKDFSRNQLVNVEDPITHKFSKIKHSAISNFTILSKYMVELPGNMITFENALKKKLEELNKIFTSISELGHVPESYEDRERFADEALKSIPECSEEAMWGKKKIRCNSFCSSPHCPLNVGWHRLQEQKAQGVPWRKI